MSEPSAKHTPNRLIHETSPYLLQHAYNPVDWHPWGEEALQRAKQENKPILLSIGYSACHWCHVMEHESFENEQIAALMNASFICIKVDREERPDLDDIYMQATLAMNQGNGGWPMTVFLTPAQEPVFAGTYFPPTDRWGRPGFATVLQKIAEGWGKDREEIVRSAERFTTRLKTAMNVSSSMAVGQAEIELGAEQFSEDFDARYGGFGRAPKFPAATGLSFLLRHYYRTGQEGILQMVTKTLDAMAAGGMYDHIGGGFARYSTDERWLVPHFEKMLYDNALLARTYVEAYQVTQDPNYRRVATETLDYILEEMTAPEGGFYSATDADSEGVEGKFFVWTPDQIREVLQDDENAKYFCAYYDITPEGNWEQASIPNTPKSLAQAAEELGCSADALQKTLAQTRPLVYHARLKRIPPECDDKIITAWNGMMISAMAEAARVLNDARYLEEAKRAAEFVLGPLSRKDGGLYRTYRKGKAHLSAYLEDYAFMIEALIDLYEAGEAERYLNEALRLAELVLSDFSDQEQGGFFTTAKDHEALIVRGREGPDGATPSGNAVAAMALARLSYHVNRDDLREAAGQAIRAYGKQIARHPRAFAKSLMALELLLNGPVELALVGTPTDPHCQELRHVINQAYIPNRILAWHHPDDPESTHPLLKGKTLVNGQAALYVCRNFACQTPITDVEHIAAALEQSRNPATITNDSTAGNTLKSEGLQGMATPEGTGRYVARMLGGYMPLKPSQHGFTALGRTGFTTSRLGFGCYRVDIEQDGYRQALRKAMLEGCNLLDTSTNYADGDSEQLVGSVIQELIDQQQLAREEVIVVSKIGYIQGKNLKRAIARERGGKPFPEIVKYSEGIWHCLHPEFLADQLTLSMNRLGVATLDVCLLHNPEYFLSEANKRKSDQLLDDVRQEFYRRLEQAFVYLEKQVLEGRIQCYGVSSNTCTGELDDPEATSVARMLDAAQRAAQVTGQPNHHFHVLQLPMNLMESGALFVPNTGARNQQTVLDFAQQEKLAVLVNRPLNAMPAKRGGMVRLAEPMVESVDVTFEDQQQKVQTLEDEYRQGLAHAIPYSGKGLEPKDFFLWAEEMTRLRSGVHNLQHWDQIESQVIAPHINQAMQVLMKQLTEEQSKTFQEWRDRYIPEFVALLRVLRQEAAMKSHQQIAQLSQLLDPLLPSIRVQESISRKSLWILASTPGVTCVLNGMRQPAYVEDSLAILGWELAGDVRLIYERIAHEC
ncbi:MAG: DUF255 domain-containing protein [Nitrospirales bacterium]|nr:DUF255 domain-containing protein [Nitrospirales bacterium]